MAEDLDNDIQQRMADISAEYARTDTPSPIEAARKRADNFVESISNNTLTDLGRRRDELDNLMERIKVSQRALGHYIGEFARFNHEVLELSKTVAASVREATVPFSKDPPATITQTDNSTVEGSKDV